MELKTYQKEVIQDLTDFLFELHQRKDIHTAFAEHWAAKGVPMRSTNDLKGQKPYRDNLGDNTPHVCIKVPTAGGKTFLATNAIRTIFDNVEGLEHQAVVWLVPSNTILEQTYKNLNDPEHPYRQKLNMLFQNRVNILSKNESIQGIDFNPTTVKENLTVMVLSFDSLRSRKKTDRLIFRENGALKQFFDATHDRSFILDDGKTDEESLINAIRYLNPVVVIDESHRAASDLSIETLRALNPSFILDLTATPRKNSNIISIIGAEKLKRENMVKLPIVVYNQKTKNEVILSALTLQRKLELQAQKMEKEGGQYIRPIVLFQAEAKSSNDTQTFEKIKKDLIETGIPENHVAIKTAEINELKNEDLLSRDCPIRYIITVNALKEGWDCPFAYILATVANRSSVIDVEQIVGRVLRQPYVRQHPEKMLNMSYVFTCSAKFQQTLDKIVEALNESGFSSKDYRVAQNVEAEAENEKPSFTDLLDPGEQGSLFGQISESIEMGISEITENIKVDTSVLQQGLEELAKNTTLNIIEKAAEQVLAAEKAAEANKKNNEIDEEIKKMSNVFEMNAHFADIGSAIRLPRFYQKQALSALFGGEQILVDKEALKAKCKLERADTNIDFDSIDYDIYKIDIEKQGDNDYVAKRTKMNRQFNEAFVEFVSSKTGDEQAKVLAGAVVRLLGKMPPFSEKDLIDYVFRIIQTMEASKRAELQNNPNWIDRIKRKINQIANDFIVKEFKKQLDTGEIVMKETFELPAQINPVKSIDTISKSLYEKEAKGNNFEDKVISKIAGLENVVFWHRIDERRRQTAFFINGYVNHYPDFLIYTKSGKVVLLEAKGDHLDGSDSVKKLKLGKIWENKSRIFGDKYRYFMIYQTSPIDENGAYSLNGFMEVMERI